MSQEIMLNKPLYDASIDRLERSAELLTMGIGSLPELKGSSPAQKAFIERIENLQGLLSSYEQALLHDVKAYRRLGATLEEADERSARSLVETLEDAR